MHIAIDLSWWLPTTAYLYLAVAVYLALGRTKHWILRVFFVALCFALLGTAMSLLIRLETIRSALTAADHFLLSRWLGLLAWPAYPIAAVAAVGVIVRLKKSPPSSSAAQEQLHAATPLHRRDKTTNRLVIAVACLTPFAIIAHILSENTGFPWFFYMESSFVTLIGGIALLVTSILLTVRDRRWLVLGLGGIIVGLMVLFPHPP